MIVIGNRDYMDNTPTRYTWRAEWYLDENRDYVLTKMLSMLPDGRVLGETTIQYTQDPELGLMPRSFERGT